MFLQSNCLVTWYYIEKNFLQKYVVVSPLLVTFGAPTAPAGQKVAAKCAEAVHHCAPASQTTDIYSYSSRK